ncbi:PH domain-containing protein [Gordonia shandongensis]|uniref:PH domain-containing protein n=1 Tax=Gordonia shandongensis TaxID=376351 RepID=UPI001FE0E004|nr:PH domain-containing protein [Gordonia shandongensis]
MHDEWATPLPASIAMIGAGLALGAAAAASYADPVGVVFLGIAAAAVIVAGAISLVRRPRLTLLEGPALQVKTLRGPATLQVDDIAQISVISTRHLFARSRQLTIDLADDRLLVFGRWDLGAAPTLVAQRLSEAGLPVVDRNADR